MDTEFHKLRAHVLLGNIIKAQTKQNVHTATTLAFSFWAARFWKNSNSKIYVHISVEIPVPTVAPCSTSLGVHILLIVFSETGNDGISISFIGMMLI